jgi:hypothetical protein
MAKRLSRRPLRRILKLQVELGPYSGEGIDSVASKTFNIAKIECEKYWAPTKSANYFNNLFLRCCREWPRMRWDARESARPDISEKVQIF